MAAQGSTLTWCNLVPLPAEGPCQGEDTNADGHLLQTCGLCSPKVGQEGLNEGTSEGPAYGEAPKEILPSRFEPLRPEIPVDSRLIPDSGGHEVTSFSRQIGLWSYVLLQGMTRWVKEAAAPVNSSRKFC